MLLPHSPSKLARSIQASHLFWLVRRTSLDEPTLHDTCVEFLLRVVGDVVVGLSVITISFAYFKEIVARRATSVTGFGESSPLWLIFNVFGYF